MWFLDQKIVYFSVVYLFIVKKFFVKRKYGLRVSINLFFNGNFFLKILKLFFEIFKDKLEFEVVE